MSAMLWALLALLASSLGWWLMWSAGYGETVGTGIIALISAIVFVFVLGFGRYMLKRMDRTRRG